LGADVQPAQVAQLLEHADRAVDGRAADPRRGELVGDLLGGEGTFVAADRLDHRPPAVAPVVPEPREAGLDFVGHRHALRLTVPDPASARLAATMIDGCARWC